MKVTTKYGFVNNLNGNLVSITRGETGEVLEVFENYLVVKFESCVENVFVHKLFV